MTTDFSEITSLIIAIVPTIIVIALLGYIMKALNQIGK